MRDYNNFKIRLKKRLFVDNSNSNSNFANYPYFYCHQSLGTKIGDSFILFNLIHFQIIAIQQFGDGGNYCFSFFSSQNEII